MAVAGALGWFLLGTSKEVIEQSQESVKQSRAALESSHNLSTVVSMNIDKLYSDSPVLREQFRKESEELDQKHAAQEKALQKQHEDLVRQQQNMLNGIAGSLFALVVFIGLLGIFFTHKVAGPIFKMKLLLKKVGDGRLNFKDYESRLRKGDELQEFFDVFMDMVGKLKGKQSQEVERLESALAEFTNDPEAARKKLLELVEEMRKTRDA